ncbi:NUDIX hydrolase [Patescibacteria group bacterium]|nr:NUDIX hydrolase [Patescibacteria group bacterium]
MAGKIKKISEKVDYECPHFKIMKNGFLIPGKEEAVYWYFLKRADYVAILAKEGNHFYMVELYRFAIQKKTLEFPAGIIEKSETPRAAAKRELAEEAGIAAKKLTFLGWYWAYIGMSDSKSYIFLAEDLSFVKQKLDESEFGMKVKKIKISDVENLIRKGKIRGEHNINSFYIYKLKNKKSRKD